MSHSIHDSDVSSSILRQTSNYYLPLYLVNQQGNGASVYGGGGGAPLIYILPAESLI